jgi:ElaB/YqjD/DUF883 family membrane-anchored ribosome-binding protein
MVRDYPGPSLMIGAGLAWMLISREQQKSVPLPQRLRSKAIHRKDQLQDVAGGAKEHILEAATDLREAAHKAKDHTLDRLGEVKHSAEEHFDSAKTTLHDRAESARESYDGILEDNPLILGAVAIAVGLAVGLLAPPTQKEDAMMGPTRDHLLDQARSIVDNARQAAVESLRSGAGSVKAHLSDAATDAKATLGESMESAKAAVKDDLASDARTDSGPFKPGLTPAADFDTSDTV